MKLAVDTKEKSFICNRCGSSSAVKCTGHDGGDYCIRCLASANAEHKANKGLVNIVMSRRQRHIDRV